MELMKDGNQQNIRPEEQHQLQKKRKDMSSGERLQLLQRKLYLKAQQEPDYKFYILYDKVFLPYILQEAYRLVKQSDGSPGIDGQTFSEIEREGVGDFLENLKEELRTRTYRPSPVKRVWIEKDDGGERPLGIPTIKDRVAQMACKIVIEPIFEADFEDSSHGFRPKRSAHDAIRQIKEHLQSGKTTVYDADLSKYFDTIPHEKLLKTLRLRITDPRVLHLIKLWLKAPVVEDGKTTGGKKNKVGTPQGGVISPLLANIYLHLLDRIVNNPHNRFAKAGIKMVRYADDFVLMGRYISNSLITELKGILERMELRVNETKSKVVQARQQPFDFLGFTIRYDKCIFREGRRFWNIKPSDKSCKRLRRNINAKLKVIGHYPPGMVVKELNPMLRGWLNYFHIEKVSYTQTARKKLQWYLRERLYRYYNRKSQRKTSLHGQRAFERLVNDFGLINPFKSSGLVPLGNNLR